MSNDQLVALLCEFFIDELLERADEYRHPDFDSDVEMLVVELADALSRFRIERLDRLASSGRRG